MELLSRIAPSKIAILATGFIFAFTATRSPGFSQSNEQALSQAYDAFESNPNADMYQTLVAIDQAQNPGGGGGGGGGGAGGPGGGGGVGLVGNITTHVSVSLWSETERQPSTPEFANWLPDGNKQFPGQEGGSIWLDVWWDSSLPDSKKFPRKITVSLICVSNYKGICSNFGSDASPDFGFPEFANGLWNINGLTAETKANWGPNQRVKIKISSFDFAARARIKVTVPLKDHAGDGHTEVLDEFTEFEYDNVTKSSKSLRIPIDDDLDGLPNGYEVTANLLTNSADTDGDGIIDCAEDEDGAPAAQADAGPAFPAGSQSALGLVGDGLTVWEEFRGFLSVDFPRKSPEKMTKGHRSFRRADITKKTLFVQSSSEEGLGDSVNLGVELLRVELTDKIPMWGPTPLDKDINYANKVGEKWLFKSGVQEQTQTGGQKALFVMRDDGANPTSGYILLGQTEVPGLQSSRVITTGANGICDTIAGPNDLQVIFPGKGRPNTLAYIVPAGVEVITGNDDTKQIMPDKTLVFTGPDGINDTVQPAGSTTLIRFQKGLPFAACITDAGDGDISTQPAGDDTKTIQQEIPAQSPNETTGITIYTENIKKVAEILKIPKDQLELSVLGHEIGHGVHVAHYSIVNQNTFDYALEVLLTFKKFSVMLTDTFAEDPASDKVKVPHEYNAKDTAQIRLHLDQ